MRTLQKAVLPLMASCLCACSAPGIVFKAKPAGSFELEEGEILYALRATDVVLVRADGKVSTDCVKPGGGALATSTWNDCLDNLSLKQVPTVDDQVSYLVKGAGGNPFAKTRLSSTVLNDDPPLVDAIAISFNDNTAQVITSIGSAATLGLAYGPVGAAVAAAGAAAGAIGNSSYLAFRSYSFSLNGAPPSNAWMTKVCDSNPGLKNRKAKDYLTAQPSPSLQLSLPYVISLDSATYDQSGCWHPMPRSSATEVSSDDHPELPRWSGWLYRFVLAPHNGDALLKESLDVKAVLEQSATTHKFPYVPCQDASIDILWWSELESAANTGKGAEYRRFPLKVSNPAFVKFAPLPKVGAIKMGTVCNAQVSFGNYTGATVESNVDALIKQTSDYKTAQKKAK